MGSESLKKYFICKFLEERNEWRTICYDETSGKLTRLKIKVKVKEDNDFVYEGITYAFNQGQNNSCWFIDILTGNKIVFKKAYGLELSKCA